MANNRMYLREKRTGQSILLCKFYPSTRWYLFPTEDNLNKWLEERTEECVREHKADDLFGPTSFELVYEHVEDGRDEPEL